MIAFETLLGAETSYLLEHTCRAIPREALHLPGSDFVDRVWAGSDRPTGVLRALQTLFDHGRLAGSGYLSILPVDHGIAYGGGSAFAANPRYFDPAAIVELAVEGGCSAVITTFGALGAVARRYAHRIPLVLKVNHHETLSSPNVPNQTLFAHIQEAWNLGCVAVGATVYFGSAGARRQLAEASEAFAHAHALGMATILFCYLHHQAFRVSGTNHELSADLTGQANHLGVTIEADLIKQKMPTQQGGYLALQADAVRYGAFDERIYTDLASEHPIDLTRYQVANGYLGRSGLINSGGASGTNDLQQAVRASIINKRAGGMGLLAGRKAFQCPMQEGITLLNAIQDVYLDRRITIA